MTLPNNHPDWIRSKRPIDKVYGDRLWHWDHGGESGGKDGAGVTWYRLNCSYWFGDWIEENCDQELWTRYGGPHRAIYIVREDLMLFIKLKWL